MLDDKKVVEYKKYLSNLAGISQKKFDEILRKEYQSLNTLPCHVVSAYNRVVVEALREKGNW
ncbi:MAG: hypothetical protein OIF32_11525 [Campylobacterales bacterium]|nr:hypothetical protein [Campylobacterales bacterium]